MKKNNSIVVLSFVLLGVGLIYFLAVSVIPQVLVTLTRAAPSSLVSISNSYFIGGKLLAKANGIDKCVVNVFAMDSTGKGVKGRGVIVSDGQGMELTGVTGADGKADFEITSNAEIQYKLSAMIDGVKFGQEITVTFRN